MPLQIWFWMLMALWIIFGFWRFRGDPNPAPLWGGHLLIFLLIGTLGWQVFGAAVK